MTGPGSGRSGPPRVAYATWDGWDGDREPVLEALRSRDLVADAVVWSEPGADWASYDLVLVRSTWDYFDRRAEYLAWADGVAAATRLANPAAVLRWNTDKTYLRDVAAAGVPVVPTHWFVPGDDVTPASVTALGWPELVVKPHVSGGAMRTIRTGEADEAAAHARSLVEVGDTAMVQPYLHMVEEEGETSLLYVAGSFSHAVERGPMLVAEPDLEYNALREPVPDQRAAAQAALAAAAAATGEPDLLYARVDLVRLEDGRPAVIELELTEPRLFLTTAPGAVERFADAVVSILPR